MSGMPLSISSTGRNIVSNPSADGDMRDMGWMNVGDYYGSGSRVRKSEVDWLTLAVVGGVVLVGIKLWRK